MQEDYGSETTSVISTGADQCSNERSTSTAADLTGSGEPPRDKGLSSGAVIPGNVDTPSEAPRFTRAEPTAGGHSLPPP